MRYFWPRVLWILFSPPHAFIWGVLATLLAACVSKQPRPRLHHVLRTRPCPLVYEESSLAWGNRQEEAAGRRSHRRASPRPGSRCGLEPVRTCRRDCECLHRRECSGIHRSDEGRHRQSKELRGGSPPFELIGQQREILKLPMACSISWAALGPLEAAFEPRPSSSPSKQAATLKLHGQTELSYSTLRTREGRSQSCRQSALYRHRDCPIWLLRSSRSKAWNP